MHDIMIDLCQCGKTLYQCQDDSSAENKSSLSNVNIWNLAKLTKYEQRRKFGLARKPLHDKTNCLFDWRDGSSWYFDQSDLCPIAVGLIPDKSWYPLPHWSAGPGTEWVKEKGAPTTLPRTKWKIQSYTWTTGTQKWSEVGWQHLRSAWNCPPKRFKGAKFEL